MAKTVEYRVGVLWRFINLSFLPAFRLGRFGAAFWPVCVTVTLAEHFMGGHGSLVRQSLAFYFTIFLKRYARQGLMVACTCQLKAFCQTLFWNSG